MTDAEILATIKLAALEAADAVKRDIEGMITAHAVKQEEALKTHDIYCPAKIDISTLRRTLGYTTESVDDSVHQRIQRVELSMTKLLMLMAGAAGVGGLGGGLVDKIFGGG